MPFQVTFSQKAIPPGVIQFLDAGEDGNAVCDTAWSLEAIIVGSLQGHAVLWEQIQGLPVTFTTPVDQVAISYTQTTFENKVFRFWVDKGTSSQRFDDVSVFGSPTTSIRKSYANSANNIIFNTTQSFLGEKLTIRIVPALPTSQHDGFVVVKVYTVADLTWEAPITDIPIVGYVVRERSPISGGWVDIATLPATAREYNGATLGNLYQVATLYKYSNSTIFDVPSNTVSISGTLDDTDIFAVDAPSLTFNTPGNRQTVTSFAIETLSISAKLETDNTENGFSTSRNKIVVSAFDIEVLSIKEKVVPFDSMIGNTFSTASNKIVMTEFDITISTGGQVGGS